LGLNTASKNVHERRSQVILTFFIHRAPRCGHDDLAGMSGGEVVPMCDSVLCTFSDHITVIFRSKGFSTVIKSFV